jgi:hypothetical protein
MIRTTTLTLSLTALLSACGSPNTDRSDTPPWTQRDSSGVTIVENEDRATLADAGFELSAEPALSIGTTDAEPEYQLYQVLGGRLLSDGRIAIVNSGSQEVRIYGPDGTYSHAFGDEGEGPGEYVRPTLVGAVGSDSLVVYDLNLRRVSIVHVDEGFVRSFPVGQEAGGFPMPNGMFSDGSQVYGGGVFLSSSDGSFPTGVIQNASKYSAVSMEGDVSSDYGEWPSFEMYASEIEGGFIARSLPFAKGSRAAVGPDDFYIGNSEAYEIFAFGPSGRLERIIRLDRPLTPVTQRDVDRLKSEEIADADSENEERTIETFFASVPVPEHMPAFGRFAVDVLGYLWVSEYKGPFVEEPEWTIFDPEGRIVGRVRMPAGTGILEIGQDYVLGRFTDELDVEYVQLWPLTRPSTG